MKHFILISACDVFGKRRAICASADELIAEVEAFACTLHNLGYQEMHVESVRPWDARIIQDVKNLNAVDLTDLWNKAR